jgi:BirA family biotin operon repressor/biotin-[acetyl-CoA-carboxylase] ligase
MSAIFTGKNLVYFNRVTSTNNVLSEMLSNSKPLAEGSVIMADEQSHGRGQHGTFWEASPGKNITISILYKPEFLTIEKQFYLSMAISIGICNFLDDVLKIKTEIKWPNDIYVGIEKIAGILIENSLMGSNLKTSIIGIGLNVNQEFFHSDAPNPCSMKLLSGIEYHIDDLLPLLFEEIEIQYLNLKAGKFQYLKDTYLHKLYRFGEDAMYKVNGKTLKGNISNIEESGKLVLLTEEGLRSFDTKEIEFIFKIN